MYSTLLNVAFSRQAEGGSRSLKKPYLKRCGQYSDIENHLSLSKYGTGNKGHNETILKTKYTEHCARILV
jgi:hypothetical protein